MNTPAESRMNRINLVLYVDRALLPALLRPALATRGPIVELARRTRLAASDLPIERASSTTVSSHRAWHRIRRRLNRPEHERTAATVVCHLDDLETLLQHIHGVRDVRLLWHPADRPDTAVEILLGRLEESSIGGAVGPHPVYHCGLGRPASADDWRRAASCPVLAMFANTARRRRHRRGGGPLTVEAPRAVGAVDLEQRRA